MADNTLLLISRLITALDLAIQMSDQHARYRELVANAVAEGRDLTDAELAELRAEARESIDKLGD